MTSRPKVAVIHPRLHLGGGSEACVMVILEALQSGHDLTLISSNRIRMEEFNRFYGTAVDPARVRVEVAAPARWLRSSRRFAALRSARLARACKARAGEFDVMFSTYNEMDFGRPGIQYILDPLFTRSLLLLLNPRPSPLRRIFYRNAALRRSYLGLARRLSRTDPAGIRRNLTLVDSDWTGGWTRTHLGVEPVTLYPPVPDPGPGRPWDQREEGFVCLGRIIPEKQADKVLTIVEGLRARGIEAHLHIIGSIGDRAFGRRLKAAAADRPWVRIEERVSAEQKRVILASHRYGLHGKENEPFGIAVAEMAAAGCLVWVPAGGGQTEIVGHPDLIYESVPEAVSKIQAILGSPERRDALRDALRGRMARFSTERFAKEVGAVVRRFLEGGSAGGEGGR